MDGLAHAMDGRLRSSWLQLENSGRVVMKSNVALLMFFNIVFVVVSIPVLAHHGTNISYDNSKPTTLKGTVTEFVWRNHHEQLYFVVKDYSGNVVHCAGDLKSIGVLSSHGLTRTL